MSNFTSLNPLNGGTPGTAPTLFSASTPDTLAVMSAAGYLDDLLHIVKQNDVFYVNYLDTSTFPLTGPLGHEASTLGEFYANISGGHLSLVSALTASGTAGAKAASDNTQPFLASIVGGPVTVNDLASFADVNGSIKDSGFSVANGLLAVPSANGLVAHSGGGQTLALALTKQLNVIGTVAAAGDSVRLPASVAGMSITVVNNGANSLQVFGAGTDTINGNATAVGVSQTPGSVAVYYSALAGAWESAYSPGNVSGFPLQSAVNGLTAFATGGQAGALPLAAQINRVTIVATAGDSVKLPLGVPGMHICVINAAASNSMNVFPFLGDAINALGANAAFAMAANKNCYFDCAVAGFWNSNLTA